MQVNIEDKSQVQKVVHVEIPEDEIKREIDDAYRDLRRNAKVKGFRPGKAPRAVLERLYNKNVTADVSAKLIQNSFAQALEATELKVVGSPAVDPTAYEGSGPFNYDILVDVLPDIEDIDFKGLSINKPAYPVTDDQIDYQLQMLQKTIATSEAVTPPRPLREGDLAIIDYEGFQDGAPIPEAQFTENFSVLVGEGRFIKAFEDQIVGMNPGDIRTVTVNFPEDYPNPKFANKTVDFKVQLKEVRKQSLPEVNDEFAKQFGKYDTLEALKQDIRSNIETGNVKRADQEVKEQIFQGLLPKVSFDVPPSLVEEELKSVIADVERTYAYRGKTLEEEGATKEDLAIRYRGLAENQVKRSMILDKLIKQEDLSLTDEELDEGMTDMAEKTGQRVEEIKSYYDRNKEALEYFKHALLEKKAIKVILDHSVIQETTPEAQPE